MTLMHKPVWVPGSTATTTPGTAYQLNGASFWKSFDLTALAAIDDTGFSAYANDAPIYIGVPGYGEYVWQYGHTLTEDGQKVVNGPTGQWTRRIAVGPEFKKITAAGTWTPESGLSSNLIAKILVDASALTGGLLTLKVDGTPLQTINAGEIKNRIVEASSSISLVAEDVPADLGDSSYTGAFDFSSYDSAPKSFSWANDGSKLYIFGTTGNFIFEFDAATDYNGVTGVTDSGNSFDVGNANGGLYVSNDGSKCFYISGGQDKLLSRAFGTDYDISTLGSESASGIFGISYVARYGLDMTDDLANAYIFESASGVKKIHQMTLSTAGDVTSMATSPASTLDVSAQVTSAGGVAAAADNSVLWVLDGSTSIAYEYDTPSGPSLSGASYSGNAYDMSSQDSSMEDIKIHPALNKFWAVGSTNGKFYEYSKANNITGTAYAEIVRDEVYRP